MDLRPGAWRCHCANTHEGSFDWCFAVWACKMCYERSLRAFSVIHFLRVCASRVFRLFSLLFSFLFPLFRFGRPDFVYGKRNSTGSCPYFSTTVAYNDQGKETVCKTGCCVGKCDKSDAVGGAVQLAVLASSKACGLWILQWCSGVGV